LLAARAPLGASLGGFRSTAAALAMSLIFTGVSVATVSAGPDQA